ncbi:HNH endonuclease [Alteromonas pelagimontana]|uniref:HNH endonuclease n=2 Tax=Alteromonas pelagimontana TaxID=1858656 RepID=A0A6M4MJC8_9ALTE|nr:HNH endonuclease [Alteromonas pelagimontana]
MSVKELTPLFNSKFDLSESVNQVKAFLKNHGITSGRTGHFKKGQESWNKGMKGLQIGGEETRFKKGSTPPNRKPIGSERICKKDGYIYIKVAERNPHTGHPTRYRLKQRYLWEQHHGPIPKGMTVAFRDNDKTNCDIENLMLISRAQLAMINRFGLANSPAEMKDTTILFADLTMKLKAA